MRGVVIFDSHARVIWMTKPAVGTKEDYLGVLAWEYAATTDDIQRVQLAWAHTLTFGTPVGCSFDTHPNVVAGSWHHTYQRLDNTPIVVVEWRAIITNPLGKRELEVALYYANDWKAGEIAEKFSLTGNTVETMRRRITHKLGVRGVAGITRWPIRAGFIDAYRHRKSRKLRLGQRRGEMDSLVISVGPIDKQDIWAVCRPRTT